MVSLSRAGVCEVMPRRKMSSLAVYTIVFQAEVLAILGCLNDFTERNYSQTASRSLEAS
jgi:hypothetical protein